MKRIVDIKTEPVFLKDLYNIEVSCFPGDAWSFESVKQSLDNSHSLILGCAYQGRLAGFINLFEVCGEAELNRIAVLKQFRKQGIAAYLMEEAVSVLKNNGCTRIVLEVRSLNQPAIELYSKFGFQTDCIRKNYYQNPSDDAILMSLNI